MKEIIIKRLGRSQERVLPRAFSKQKRRNCLMADFKMEKVAEMIEEQMAKGTDFEQLVYEFRHGYHDCTVSVKHIKENGRFVASLGVEVPETNRMFFMDCSRENNLEAVLEFFKNKKNEPFVLANLKFLIERVNQE